MGLGSECQEWISECKTMRKDSAMEHIVRINIGRFTSTSYHVSLLDINRSPVCEAAV